MHRNFQGYTVLRGADVLAFGMSGISDAGTAYWQSARKLTAYNAAIDAGRLPVARGFALSDDEARRWLSRELMCGFRLREADVRERLGVGLDEGFPEEMRRVDERAAEGLVRRTLEGIEITPLDRLFVRVVASAFDRYLHEGMQREGERVSYSRAV